MGVILLALPTPSLFGYVCNTAVSGPLKVIMYQPPILDTIGIPKEVVVHFENTGDNPLELNLNWRSISPITFAGTKNDKRETITIPAKSTCDHKITIIAGPNCLTTHYPINLDVSFTDSTNKQTTLNVVYPVQTRMPQRTDWKISDQKFGNIKEDWDQARWTTPSGRQFVFKLEGTSGHERSAEIVLGSAGLVDSLITLKDADSCVSWQGIQLWIAGLPLYRYNPGPFTSTKEQNSWTQSFQIEKKTEQLFYSIRQNRFALELSITCSNPDLLNQITFGPCSQKLDALWLGHGYYIKKPGTMKIVSDGSHFSTSFVGFDFENGCSILMASSSIIGHLAYTPEKNQCSIFTKSGTTITLIPGSVRTGSAMDCAIRYRDIFDKKPASGVRAKAGRFVVDVWNGRFTEHTRLIKDAAKYGLKNDLIFLSHNWQRFRYDHRLPDVYPPNPLFGTVEEIKETLKTARENGWYFGTHNNVIDYYPDSTRFSFDNVAFLPDGTPQKAYRNVFLDAQSYRLAPHRAPIVLGECLEQMNRDGFVQNALFVDVLASYTNLINSFYYDHRGNYYSPEKATKGTGEVFNTIHRLQDAALTVNSKSSDKSISSGQQSITVSEGGHDGLIGTLDGSDCQFLYLTKTAREYGWFRISEFDNAVKVPWFDTVNHQKFIHHGAGYSIRFEGGRGRELHGLDSDDYISIEAMTGHPPMTDAYCRDVKEILSGYVRHIDHNKALYQTVRKYYLLQGLARQLALDEIVRFEFIDSNIFHQKITWKSGTIVYVNRGDSDWHIGDSILPQYGYRAENPKSGLLSTICRLQNRVVEYSLWKEGDKRVYYVNARNRPLEGLVPVSPLPTVAGTRQSITIKLNWNIFQNQKLSFDPYTFTFYLVRRKGAETTLGEDYLLKSITADFQNPLEFNCALPPKLQGIYDLLITVVPKGKDIENVDNRLKLLATPSFFYRYHLGNVSFDNDGTLVFHTFENGDNALYERLFPPEKPIDFGFCKTKGGFRIIDEPGKETPVIIPLPGDENTEIQLGKLK